MLRLESAANAGSFFFGKLVLSLMGIGYQNNNYQKQLVRISIIKHSILNLSSRFQRRRSTSLEQFSSISIVKLLNRLLVTVSMPKYTIIKVLLREKTRPEVALHEDVRCKVKSS